MSDFVKCFWNPDPTILTQLLKHNPQNKDWRITTSIDPLFEKDMIHLFTRSKMY